MYNKINFFVDDLFLALPVSVITAVIYWFVRRAIHKKRLGYKFKGSHKKAVWNEVIRVLFVFWTALVFGGTLLPTRLDIVWLSQHGWKIRDLISFSPQWDFFAEAEGLLYLRNYFSSHFLLNIMMFVPIGLALPFVLKKQNFGKVIIIGFCMSLLIELIQPFVHRGAALDDLICNTLGTVIGYLLYLLMKLIFPNFTEKCKIKINNAG